MKKNLENKKETGVLILISPRPPLIVQGLLWN